MPTYDVDKLGVPKFVNTNYIELSHISQISKFRSSIGHDYSDSVEGCRSMKHYFMFPGTSTLLYAPVSGIIALPAVSGDKIVIQSDAQPAFWFMIFHPILTKTFAVGERVTEGQVLGTHESPNTHSDIAVLVSSSTGAGSKTGYGPGGRLVSYFDTLTDRGFQPFRERGINSPADLVFTQPTRDANPLTCSGDRFVGQDPLSGPEGPPYGGMVVKLSPAR